MHTLTLSQTEKSAVYQEILPQIKSIIESEINLIANLANVTAVLKQSFGWFWVGFYLIDNASNELVLGPFQGPLACTRIAFGKGVCGQSWQQQNTIIVPDVNAHPGHIACSSQSQSEIVVPIISNDSVIGVLDVDADKVNQFNQIDATYLETLVQLLAQHHTQR